MGKIEATPLTGWAGFCPICEKETFYRVEGPWFRDDLVCEQCPGGSIPRERALMLTIRQMRPDWRSLAIHESSPAPRAASAVLARDCKGYVATQFFPGIPAGTMVEGYRAENLESQTFGDAVFDMVVSQDVMEHVFHPEKVYREIHRTLKPGGLYIHTTPINKGLVTTRQRARIGPNGAIEHLMPATYHGNPIERDGSLVTFDYGYDLHDLIAGWADFAVTITRFNDRRHGIVAEFSEVVVCRRD